jgi:hypothetical protein
VCARRRQESGKTYVQVMKKIKELGTDFIKTEMERVKKLKESKLTEKKKESMDMRLNILASFKNAAAGTAKAAEL